MKQATIISILIVLLVVPYPYSFAHMQGSMMGSQSMEQTGQTVQSGQYHPCYQTMGGGMMGYPMMGNMGRYGMGPGMMGYGMGPGITGYSGHMGPGMMGYGGTEENKKFLDDTAGMRRELHIKKFDYFEALRNPDSKAETIGKLIKDIQKLQEKIYEKAKTAK